MMFVFVRMRLVVRASCVGCARVYVARCADQRAHARNDKNRAIFGYESATIFRQEK